MILALLPLIAFVLAISVAPIVTGHMLRGRGARGQLLGTVGWTLAGVAFGVWLYLSRSRGVISSQALEGAGLGAGLLVALPAALYLQLGYRVQKLALACGVWLATLLPLLFYLLIVALGVQHDIECPTGESCAIFS